MKLSPNLAPAGYSPNKINPLSLSSNLNQSQRLTDIQAIQRLFANGENGGYWPADPTYLFEDSAGTIPASVNGVVGLRANNVPGKPNAIQATTANKPYLRRTPVSNRYWLDSNTENGALTATFESALGSTCTIATVGPDGVSILENQTVSTTYDLTPLYSYNSDVLVINRALTAVEKALVTRALLRNQPALGIELATNGTNESAVLITTGGTNLNLIRVEESGNYIASALSTNGNYVHRMVVFMTTPLRANSVYSFSALGRNHATQRGVCFIDVFDGSYFSSRNISANWKKTAGVRRKATAWNLAFGDNYNSSVPVGNPAWAVDDVTVKEIL